MQEILNGLGDGINAILNDPTIQTIFRATILYVGLIWLAAAYWAYRDLRQRTANPLLPYGAAATIILFTPIFFPLAVILYRIVRPPETVSEASERSLAEEAMLVEVEKQHHCAACKRPIEADWLICPHCRTRLRRVCSSCGRLVETDWSLCAYCGKDFERPDYTRTPARVPAGRAAAAIPSGQTAAIAAGSAGSGASGASVTSNVRALPRSQAVRGNARGDGEQPRAARGSVLPSIDDVSEEVPETRTATRGT
jgi:RNA polymerase subunit RPABC4/transcription elongation factor Spt4